MTRCLSKQGEEGTDDCPQRARFALTFVDPGNEDAVGTSEP